MYIFPPKRRYTMFRIISRSRSSKAEFKIIDKYFNIFGQSEEYTNPQSSRIWSLLCLMTTKEWMCISLLVIYPSLWIPFFFSLPLSTQTLLSTNQKSGKEKLTDRQSFESQANHSLLSSFPILHVLVTFKKCAFLLVLALIPCFLEKEALGRYKMDLMDSVDYHWTGMAYIIHTPWRSTPSVSTLRVAALRLPSIHKLGPVWTNRWVN